MLQMQLSTDGSEHQELLFRCQFRLQDACAVGEYCVGATAIAVDGELLPSTGDCLNSLARKDRGRIMALIFVRKRCMSEGSHGERIHEERTRDSLPHVFK